MFLLVMLFSAFVSISPIQPDASEASRQQYLELIKSVPSLVHPKGDFTQGEIQIVVDPQEMAAIETEMQRDVGVIVRDRYWLWINDACIFPSGRKGVYGRILWTSALTSPSSGVAVMPIMPDGTIVLNCNFRHSTRSWEIELPRGVVNVGEKAEAAAKREAMEETGMIVDSLCVLGEIPPDTGLTSTIVPVFMAKVVDVQNPEQEETEAIEEILSLPVKEIKQAFVQGYLEREIKGVKKRVHFRDPFLAYAILLYELRQG